MDLCMACLDDLPWLGVTCRYCGIPLTTVETVSCGACLSVEITLDQCVVALAYEYPVAQMIAALKYRRDTSYARVLGELLSIRLLEAVHANELQLPELLLPVPLHPLRQIRRTFNQSLLIAEHLVSVLGVPVGKYSLRRIRNTPPQTGLSRNARQKNLRRSFAVNNNLDGMSIAIIDDVITTATTVREISRVLKRAGVAEVQVWAVARAAHIG